ncbi:hypothetical protein GCM10027599_11930 [Yimella radicis]
MPRIRRICRLGRKTSSTGTPAELRYRARPAPERDEVAPQSTVYLDDYRAAAREFNFCVRDARPNSQGVYGMFRNLSKAVRVSVARVVTGGMCDLLKVRQEAHLLLRNLQDLMSRRPADRIDAHLGSVQVFLNEDATLMGQSRVAGRVGNSKRLIYRCCVMRQNNTRGPGERPRLDNHRKSN